jgi:hypothetical protein
MGLVSVLHSGFIAFWRNLELLTRTCSWTWKSWVPARTGTVTQEKTDIVSFSLGFNTQCQVLCAPHPVPWLSILKRGSSHLSKALASLFPPLLRLTYVGIAIASAGSASTRARFFAGSPVVSDIAISQAFRCQLLLAVRESPECTY